VRGHLSVTVEGLSDIWALRRGAASIAAGETASRGYCLRQFHRLLDTLWPCAEVRAHAAFRFIDEHGRGL